MRKLHQIPHLAVGHWTQKSGLAGGCDKTVSNKAG